MVVYVDMQTAAGTIQVPAHLLQYELDNEDEIESRLIEATESEAVSFWEKCDMAALLHALHPYYNPDGSVNRENAGYIKSIAAIIKRSTRQTYRYISLANTFPPAMRIDGKLVQIRDYAQDQSLYLTALDAPNYGMSPLEVITRALYGDPPMLEASQLARWMRDPERYKNGTVPPVWRTFYDYELTAEGRDAETLADILMGHAAASILEQIETLQSRGVGLEGLRLSVHGLVPVKPLAETA